MPVRFDLPRVGGSTRPQLMAHEWQIDFAYRRLSADQWYVGTAVNESAAPFGRTLYVDINSIAVAANYGITDRLSTSMTFPFSYGTHSRFYQDNARHEVEATGFGDLSFVTTYWLWDPKRPAKGNLSIGLGTKSSSGDNAVSDNWYFANDTLAKGLSISQFSLATAVGASSSRPRCIARCTKVFMPLVRDGIC